MRMPVWTSQQRSDIHTLILLLFKKKERKKNKSKNKQTKTPKQKSLELQIIPLEEMGLDLDSP